MAHFGRKNDVTTARAIVAAQERQVRTYTVRTMNGEDTVEANFAFNNGDEGLVFRRYRGDGTDKTYVVASYAQGHWSSYGEK